MTNANRRKRVDNLLMLVGHVTAREFGQTEREAELRLVIESEEAAVQHLIDMRAMPEAKRMAGCSPVESALRIFGDAAIDQRIQEARQRVAEWRGELHLLQSGGLATG